MTEDPAARGLLVVLAGPSGVGKGTVMRRVLAAIEDAEISVSATTRAPRPGEVDGQHYWFLDRDAFDERVAADDFLEWAEFAGNRYGTLRSTVHERLAAGAVVVLEIEVQGARQVREREPDALLVFMAPPSMDELARRLAWRGTETEDEVHERLEVARWELEQAGEFDHVLVNDDPDRTGARLVGVIVRARDADGVS